MGVFNALVAVKADATLINANLAIELERVLTPWKAGRFDWYAIGVTDHHFAAYLHPELGWLDDDDSPISLETVDIPFGHAIIPIRCHD